MQPFTIHKGKVAVLNRKNVDTDQIIPKQFLKRIERTGYGRFAFYDWRYLSDGSNNPEFELNNPIYQGASILIAGENFGCGSSREHAPWSLGDYGFRVILAPSFADIFYQNCLKNGILPIRMSHNLSNEIMTQAADKEYYCQVDLENQMITDDNGNAHSFEIDHHWKDMLLHGRDEISLTLLLDEQIKQYESENRVW
ncbi:3-isopropylmalate dehydratase small subunit [Metabacillus arenae]|uniref:3-isopropylmalate dehydratase small subunit n=1 Tax=Metabacillus arenae TaxID=2771434 RepID=A0A926NBG2_9BACI|nr:3-isopropylmalate dehydratase small subunit [Metabacillus arenae]MBD1381172.1 3-isopropylmalate dehydratase small subunit [Metabacillus arenae]